MDIEVFRHSSIKLVGSKTIYFDPYQISDDYHDANYIFITHDHYDHYDEKSIKKIMTKDTTIIAPACLREKISTITNNILIVEPEKTYYLADMTIKTIPAYNINTNFHPKEKSYVGYNVLIDNQWYYIMGDTSKTKEALTVITDICFVPIGGIYTMDVVEAASYINTIKPQTTIPIHYGDIVGEKHLAEDFKRLIDKKIKVEILI